MRIIEFKPLIGAGPVTFGMTRDEVHTALLRERELPRRGRSDREEVYFSHFLFRIYFDELETVKFIEIGPNRDNQVHIVFNDCVLNTMKPEEAVEFVSQFAEYAPNADEPSDEYIFPELQLSLWRSFAGRAEEHAADTTGEFRFLAYGCGRRGYFDATLQMKMQRMHLKRSAKVKNPFEMS